MVFNTRLSDGISCTYQNSPISQAVMRGCFILMNIHMLSEEKWWLMPWVVAHYQQDQRELCTDARSLSSKVLAKMKMIILKTYMLSFLLIVLSAKDIKIELNTTSINNHQGNWSLPLCLLFMIMFIVWIPDGCIPYKIFERFEIRRAWQINTFYLIIMVLMANKTTQITHKIYIGIIHIEVYGDVLGNPRIGLLANKNIERQMVQVISFLIILLHNLGGECYQNVFASSPFL